MSTPESDLHAEAVADAVDVIAVKLDEISNILRSTK